MYVEENGKIHQIEELTTRSGKKVTSKSEVGDQEKVVAGITYQFDLTRGEYVDAEGKGLSNEDGPSGGVDPLQRVEEKLDFLLQKQVQRDLEETLKSQEVDPGV
ncbi:hypothetical protein SANA_22780 [Gottschalkiaceae bacterium SANA]|nr:hypothetical protein SANA_22780 [Gottschalkiaceae bacterium SANA]